MASIFNKRILFPLAVLALFLFQGCAVFHGKGGVESSAPISAASAERPAEIKEFILGSGDKLDISVYRNSDLAKVIQIDPAGNIDYPLVGVMRAEGLSIFELKTNLGDALKKYLKNPQISIGVVSTQSQKVTVLGEVKRPGFFQLNGGLTMLEAISGAGGFTADGKKTSVLLIRGGLKNPELKAVNLQRTLSKGDLRENITLSRGDIVYVPRTTIANVDRFFMHLSTILDPLLDLERGYFIGQKIELGNSRSSLTIPVN